MVCHKRFWKQLKLAKLQKTAPITKMMNRFMTQKCFRIRCTIQKCWTCIDESAQMITMFTIDEHVMQYSTLLTYILVGVLFVVVGFRPPWWNKKSSSSSHCYDERAAQNIPGN
ncbi:unnamed protein product [Acanthoscelides obtectus]|uniref:Uncharacterized protein n=1 Tax=Acanthoscelides obtectus TaxID=200917 RepID=A0A9P0MCI4_ACAOB|nr:unnamed protein product [Acanthoscelides obtectus]CAK1650398.1 hypothetical protein AOBTE_LOCUS16761 [Acanthoscelides obtectus]